MYGSLSRLLDDVSFEVFFNVYFEKKWLHQKGGNSKFESLFSIEDLNNVLFSQKLFAPAFRWVNSGLDEFPKSNLYCLKDSNTIDPIKFVKGFDEGHTLAMAGIHNHHQKMREFCHSLENELGHPFQTNFYLTPKESKGFKPHWDTHDVFVLQLEGKKIWRIFENGKALADKNLTFEVDGFEPGAVAAEFEMEKGDFLYIPRGITHAAYTEDSYSLHITIGWLGYTWSQLLIESILTLTRENKDFRRFIPLGRMSVVEDYSNYVESLLHMVNTELKTKKGLLRFTDEMHAGQFACSHDLLTQVINLHELSSYSLVSTLTKNRITLKESGDKIRVHYLDTFLEFPEFCKVSLDYIFDNKNPYRIDEIPTELDESGILVLVKKLIKENLVRKVY